MRIKILFLVIFFSFFIGLSAKADLDISQPVYNTDFTFGTSTITTISQSFIPATSTLASFGFWLKRTQPLEDGDEFILVLIKGNAPNFVGDEISRIHIYKAELLSLFPLNTWVNYHLNYPTSLNLTAGDYYTFILNTPGSVSMVNRWQIKTSNLNSYSNGRMTYGTYFTEITNYDWTFNTFTFKVLDIQTALWHIDVIDPTENWVYTSMPNFVLFHYVNTLGFYQRAYFNIYKLDSKHGNPVSETAPAIGEVATTTQPITLGGAQFYLNNGYYRLYNAHFLTSSVNYLDQPIDFEVAVGSSSPAKKNASTSLATILEAFNDDTICQGITTSTGITDLHIFGDIECGLKKVGLFLFKPDDASITALIGSFLDIKADFPFNTFFGITDAIQAGISTSTTEYYLPVPFITATGTITSLPVVGSSSLPNLIGQENNNLFRTGLIAFAWLLNALIIYLTIRKI